MRLRYELNRAELEALQYPVVVETWDKVVTTGQRSRRLYERWLLEFSESERRRARKLHNMFRSWYLRRGTPNVFCVGGVEDLRFVERVISFFGGCW